ncbi:MAG: exo-rhamnogalacturonan lyase family protein, partial [Kiritimatiellia bacterium]
MKARGWYWLLIAVAVASRVFALELQNVPGADFKPGQLRLPLTVHERSGVERKGAVVTSGVPFPVGFLHDVKRLCVLDAASNAVPCQAIRMVKWHKPIYDDSVQWALVSFQCNVPANGTATYYLTDTGQTAPATKLKVEKRESGISVDTGVAVFVVPLQGQSLVRKATIGGKDILAGEGLRSVIISGDWQERGLKQGDVHIGTIESVTVEEEGPVRVVIAIKGRHTPGDKDGKFYGFMTRLYFEADSPSVRVLHSLTNCKLDPQLHDGWRYVYTWPIEDASLVADLALRDGVKITTTAEGQPLTRSQGLRVYQDSSGGDKWQNLGGGNYEGWISRYTGGLTIRGVTFRGYKVYEKESEIAAGNSHPGVLDVSDGARGLTVALRNFRVEYPHALAGEPGRLRIGLFPGEFSEPFHLNAGQRKSWDLRLFTHGAELPDLQECFAVQDTLLLFRPAPAWMVRAGAEGAWPYGIALVPNQGRKPSKQRLDKEKLDGIHVGWDWYGWISGYNSGGGHWNEETVSLPWVLWGDGENFDDVERKTLWSADLTALHWDEPDISTFWLMLMSWNDHENRLKRVAYPGWYNRDTWGLPDSGHMGVLMWPEYYFLTGDMRAREAIEHLGIRARAILWQYNHDDKNDGTGPLPRAIN